MGKKLAFDVSSQRSECARNTAKGFKYKAWACKSARLWGSLWMQVSCGAWGGGDRWVPWGLGWISHLQGEERKETGCGLEISALSRWVKPSLQQSHAMFYATLHPIFRRHTGPGLQTDAHCLAQWESTCNISIIHTFRTCSSFLEKVRGIFCNFELSLAISLICSPPVVPVLQTHLSYFPQFWTVFLIKKV